MFHIKLLLLVLLLELMLNVWIKSFMKVLLDNLLIWYYRGVKFAAHRLAASHTGYAHSQFSERKKLQYVMWQHDTASLAPLWYYNK